MMKDMSLCEGEASEISADCRKSVCVCECVSKKVCERVMWALAE